MLGAASATSKPVDCEEADTLDPSFPIIADRIVVAKRLMWLNHDAYTISVIAGTSVLRVPQRSWHGASEGDDSRLHKH